MGPLGILLTLGPQTPKETQPLYLGGGLGSGIRPFRFRIGSLQPLVSRWRSWEEGRWHSLERSKHQGRACLEVSWGVTLFPQQVPVGPGWPCPCLSPSPASRRSWQEPPQLPGHMRSSAKASVQAGMALCPSCWGTRPPSTANPATRRWCRCLIRPYVLFWFQRTPGPGAYTSSRQFPKQNPTIAKMGREHSLFFNNTIGF